MEITFKQDLKTLQIADKYMHQSMIMEILVRILISCSNLSSQECVLSHVDFVWQSYNAF